MSGNDLSHLSSCVLCGRLLGDEAEPATVGGIDVRLHPDCREAGLEGRDLASPWDGAPDGDADGAGRPGPGPGGGADPSGSPQRRERGQEDGPDRDSPGPSTPAAPSEGSGADAAGGGGDPDWTRITDFS